MLLFTASNTSSGIKTACLSLNEKWFKKCIILSNPERYDYYFSFLKAFKDFIRRFFRPVDYEVLKERYKNLRTHKMLTSRKSNTMTHCANPSETHILYVSENRHIPSESKMSRNHTGNAWSYSKWIPLLQSRTKIFKF